MVSAAEGSDALWERLDSEVKRLTANRIKGKHFSEDFVVDRVCTLLSRLREQNDRKADQHITSDVAKESKPEETGEDLKALRATLDAERKQLQSLQSDVEKAKTQVQEAKHARAELDREWDQEREKQQLAREKHARTWKETALRSQLCQARLKAMEHEGTQLRAALGQPETLAKVWEGLVAKLEAELDVANVEVAEAKREHERLSAEVPSNTNDTTPIAKAEEAKRQSLTVRSEVVKTERQPFFAPTVRPTLSATSNRDTAQVADVATRPDVSQSAQLSAISASEAPYSTASILNDARRALEKLEQLKVRRVGSLSHAPQQSFATVAAPSAFSPNTQVPSSLRGPVRQATSLSPPASRMQQGSLASGQRLGAIGSSTSPTTSAQPPVQTLSATPAPTQKLSSSPSPTARISGQGAQQSQSHTPAPQHVTVPKVGATPLRPGMVQVKDFGMPFAKASPLQRPPSVPQQRVPSATPPPTMGAAKVSSPIPTVRSGSPSSTATGHLARATASVRQNVALGMPHSSTTSMPTTPDAANRVASMSAPRVGPKQVAPMALMARNTTGSSQEYGSARPQMGR